MKKIYSLLVAGLFAFASAQAQESSEKVFNAWNDDIDYGVTLTGDVPEGADCSFVGDNALAAGESETYTITGLPSNMVIKSIVADVSLGETMYSDMEIEAVWGDKKIAYLNIASMNSKVNTLPDIQSPQQSEQEYDMVMTDDAKTPGSGDLVFKLSSVYGVNENEAQGVCYTITYEIVDPTTGISDVNTSAVEVARYNAEGKSISAPQKGINLVRMSDGKTLKVLVK